MLGFYGKKINSDNFVGLIDVTDKLVSKFLSGNTLIISERYNNIFGDPLPEVLKKLYIYNGDREYEFNENETINLTLDLNSESLTPEALKRFKMKIIGDRQQTLKFDVYAICWNESRILPAFLHHYRQANRIIVFDNESNDRSQDIIKGAGREVIGYSTGNTLNDEALTHIKNSKWKNSRDVDFLIVVDIDEFVYFPNYPGDLITPLTLFKAKGIALVQTIGFNMFCTDEEWDNALNGIRSGISVFNNVIEGIRVPNRDKVLIFDPRAIQEINYAHGALVCNPEGHLIPSNDKPYCLHYKYIGYNYVLDRSNSEALRLSEFNKRNGYRVHLLGDNKSRLDKEFSKPRINVITQTALPFKGSIIDINYQNACAARTDIWEHLPTLYNITQELTNENLTIVEMGVRTVVSSWAFAKGLKDSPSKIKNLIGVDLEYHKNLLELAKACKSEGIHYQFVMGDSARVIVPPMDILFIDTWHIYGHLKRELAKHHHLVNKYIIFHDTTVDGEFGESIRLGRNIKEESEISGYPESEITKGLWPAIEEFLEANPEWKLLQRYTNCHGLTILVKK